MEKKNVKKNILTIICGAVGILIVLVTGVLSGNEADQKSSDARQRTELDAYVYTLEERIKKLCEACDGVSSVSVVITLEGGFEYEYAKDLEYGNNSYGNTGSEEYLVIGQGSNQKCVILREKLPTVAGVGIVCNGAGNDTVKRELTMLIASALNIGVNKIYITEAS